MSITPDTKSHRTRTIKVAPPFYSGDPRQNKKGRPRKEVTKKMCDLVERLAARWVTEEDIGAAIGMAHQTFISAKARSPELVEALRAGRQKVKDMITTQILKKCKHGDGLMLIWASKNVLKWTDRVEENVNEHHVVFLPAAMTIENGKVIEGVQLFPAEYEDDEHKPRRLPHNKE